MENRSYRSIVGLSALILAAAAYAPASAAPRAQRRTSDAPVRNWIVVFRDQAAQQRMGQRRTYEVTRSFRIIPGEAAALTDAQVANLRRHPDVAFVELDRPVYALEGKAAADGGFPVALSGNPSVTTLSTTQTIPYGVTMVGAQDAWYTTRGAGARVAVLDTGYDMNQADRANIALTASFIAGESVQDGNGHGTHTAGTVAAPDNGIGVVGVAPEATLLIGKVLDNEGSGTTTTLVAGIDWAVRNGAQVLSLIHI